MATNALFAKPGIETATRAAVSARPIAATSSDDIHAKSGVSRVCPVLLLTDWNSVRVSPGQRAVAETPVPRSSSCKPSVNVVTNAFVAAYTARFGAG